MMFTKLYRSGKFEIKVESLENEIFNENGHIVTRKFKVTRQLYQKNLDLSNINHAESNPDKQSQNTIPEISSRSAAALKEPGYTLLETSSRIITQFHYMSWPDHHVGEPSTLLQLLDMVNTQEECSKSLSDETAVPVVVHCAAGCGRSGAFLTIMSVLRILTKSIRNLSLVDKIIKPDLESSGIPMSENGINLYDLIALQVNMFRIDRIGSVQTRSQLQFCYDAVIFRIGEMVEKGMTCDWEIKAL